MGHKIGLVDRMEDLCDKARNWSATPMRCAVWLDDAIEVVCEFVAVLPADPTPRAQESFRVSLRDWILSDDDQKFLARAFRKAIETVYALDDRVEKMDQVDIPQSVGPCGFGV